MIDSYWNWDYLPVEQVYPGYLPNLQISALSGSDLKVV